jgi:hypothetical protein
VCSCFLRYNRLVRENTRQPFLRGLYHLPYFSPWSTRHCSVATTQPALCAHDMDSVNFHIQVLEYKSLRILQAVKRSRNVSARFHILKYFLLLPLPVFVAAATCNSATSAFVDSAAPPASPDDSTTYMGLCKKELPTP